MSGTPFRKKVRPYIKKMDRPQCKAHTRSGSPCKNAPILGGEVCRMHGGAAPQVRAAAQRRLLASSDRMAKLLLDLATSAESEAVRLAAIKDALDRAGLTAKQQVELSLAPWEEALQGGETSIVVELDEDVYERVAAKDAGGTYDRYKLRMDPGTVIPGEVVEAEPDPPAPPETPTPSAPTANGGGTFAQRTAGRPRITKARQR